MQVELGTFRIDTGTRRLFPAYRPPRSLILALLYSMAMVFVYTLLFEIYCLVALVIAAIWLTNTAFRWIEQQRAVAARKRVQQRGFEDALRRRADEQNADYLAGGSGLPEAPLFRSQPNTPGR
ncbi:hypothetical protein [Nocardia sp. N2S4-5]|uniref:hypothetical protein n=1 Tax=Nocardia sp. N2S4-5 TaxID=3351565 RepID=UPI0037D047B1